MTKEEIKALIAEARFALDLNDYKVTLEILIDIFDKLSDDDGTTDN